MYVFSLVLELQHNEHSFKAQFN